MKNKDKRAQYDAQRQFGGFNPFGQQGARQQSGTRQHYQQANPFGQGGNPFGQGGNPFGQYQYGQQQARQQWQGPNGQNPNPEDFMRWYKSNFGDAFRDFHDVSRSSHTNQYGLTII